MHSQSPFMFLSYKMAGFVKVWDKNSLAVISSFSSIKINRKETTDFSVAVPR